MPSVPSLAATLHKRIAEALSAALPQDTPGEWIDPMLRRSDRADFQANGVLALAKRLKTNPRELATGAVESLPPNEEKIRLRRAPTAIPERVMVEKAGEIRPLFGGETVGWSLA